MTEHHGRKCPKCGASDNMLSFVIMSNRKDIKVPFWHCNRIGCRWEKEVSGFDVEWGDSHATNTISR